MMFRSAWWRSHVSLAWILGALVLTGLFLGASNRAGTTEAAPAAPLTAASDLQNTLDNLLSEHADLAILGMQKGYDGSADFMPAAAQLAKNTDDLSAAIGSVYGADAAAKFKALWTAHIGFFVDYATATKANDAAKKQTAKTNLDGYKKDIAAFLSGANPNLPNDAVQATFQAHIDQLLSAFDAYVAKDYAKAYLSFHEAHDHMFMAGATLAGAIAKQMPQKFPDTAAPAAGAPGAGSAATTSPRMPNTGTGGLAGQSGSSNAFRADLVAALAVLASLVGGGMLLSKRLGQR
jgi:hypothetical protein